MISKINFKAYEIPHIFGDDKDIDIEGLVFAYVPGLYATYDYEVDFEDSLMDLTDEYNLSYLLLDSSTICIFED